MQLASSSSCWWQALGLRGSPDGTEEGGLLSGWAKFSARRGVVLGTPQGLGAGRHAPQEEVDSPITLTCLSLRPGHRPPSKDTRCQCKCYGFEWVPGPPVKLSDMRGMYVSHFCHLRVMWRLYLLS